METLLINEFQHIEFAIFDFDGTLTHLNVNWDELREKLKISSIEEVWGFPEHERKAAWSLVSEAEVAAIEFASPISSVFRLLSHIDFAILTNNSEMAVSCFLAKQNLGFSEHQIIGRTWLGSSKRNFEVFNNAIGHILREKSMKNIAYFGDSDYELKFSELIGLESFKVNEDGNISRLRDEQQNDSTLSEETC